MRKYRVVQIDGGHEPQMLCNAGLVKGEFWYPLNQDGYFAEPEAFNSGAPIGRYPIASDAAERAILRAMKINGDSGIRLAHQSSESP